MVTKYELTGTQRDKLSELERSPTFVVGLNTLRVLVKKGLAVEVALHKFKLTSDGERVKASL